MNDPALARVLFLILRDHMPYGDLAAAIETSRAVLRETPPTHLGMAARELAERINKLDSDS